MSTPSFMKQFDFGQNWADFSEHAATRARALQACNDFAELMGGIDLIGKTLLDIGFGQGFSLLSASSLGCRVTGCDINPKCHQVIESTREFFPEARVAVTDLHVGSILDDAIVARLRTAGGGGYDIVHSWGVLHHTGNMKRALVNAASLVRPGGHLVIAIYNRHWSSATWRIVKRLYVHSPALAQRALVSALYPVIWIAKLVATGHNPRRMDRGMDFYYDVVDWVGGYPYEYASIREMEQLCRPLGLMLERSIAAKVPTGCNELIFRKRG